MFELTPQSLRFTEHAVCKSICSRQQQWAGRKASQTPESTLGYVFSFFSQINKCCQPRSDTARGGISNEVGNPKSSFRWKLEAAPVTFMGFNTFNISEKNYPQAQEAVSAR
jgi:hypothetical protein